MTSQRGPEGGYGWDTRPRPSTVADIFRAIEGPLAEVRGERPEDTTYCEPADNLPQLWVAVRSALRLVLESTTLADLLTGELPPAVAELVAAPDAWRQRPIGRSGALR